MTHLLIFDSNVLVAYYDLEFIKYELNYNSNNKLLIHVVGEYVIIDFINDNGIITKSMSSEVNGVTEYNDYVIEITEKLEDSKNLNEFLDNTLGTAPRTFDNYIVRNNVYTNLYTTVFNLKDCTIRKEPVVESLDACETLLL